MAGAHVTVEQDDEIEVMFSAPNHVSVWFGTTVVVMLTHDQARRLRDVLAELLPRDDDVRGGQLPSTKDDRPITRHYDNDQE